MEYAHVWQLVSPTGTAASVTDQGAALCALSAPDNKGRFVNVALPPTGTDDPSYAGATLAPYAGRIRNSVIHILGQRYSVTSNENAHQLHGGPHNLAHRLWRVDSRSEGEGWRQLCFVASLPDGADGFPGFRAFRTTYRLWDDDRLELTLEAKSDRPALINLSHHAYWNLSGDLTRSVDDHLLSVNADKVYLNDEAHLPIDVCCCAQPPFDFGKLRPLMRPQEANHAQLTIANGFNHAFQLRGGSEPAARLIDPASGRRLRLYTDQPCLVVYAGGYLSVPRCAVALEAQGHPLAPFAPPPALVTPEAPYRRRICYAFDTVDTPT